MFKKLLISIIFLAMASVAISQDLANTFLPKDLMKNKKILLLKVPYTLEETPYNQEKAPYTDRKSIDKLNEFMAENFSGPFEIVESSKSIDMFYPDTAIYKYVLVFAGAIKEGDFKDISNKDNFFDKADSSFFGSGSSLYIFDRTSNHILYETNEKAITYSLSKMNNRGLMQQIEFINYKKLKKYIQLLNN